MSVFELSTLELCDVSINECQSEVATVTQITGKCSKTADVETPTGFRQ